MSAIIQLVAIGLSVSSFIGTFLLNSTPIDLNHASQIGELVEGSMCISDGLEVACNFPNIFNMNNLVDGMGCTFLNGGLVCNTSFPDYFDTWVSCAENYTWIGDACVNIFDTMVDLGFVQTDALITMSPNMWCKSNALATHIDCIYSAESDSGLVDTVLGGVCRGTGLGTYACLEAIEDIETDPKTGSLTADAMCLGVTSQLFECDKQPSEFFGENNVQIKNIVFTNDGTPAWCRNDPFMGQIACDIDPIDSTTDLVEGDNLYFTQERVYEILIEEGVVEDPNGLEDMNNTLELDESRRGTGVVFWIMGSHTFYSDGVRYVHDSTSVVLEAEDGTTYIFYDGDVLSYSRDLPRTGTVRIASIYHSGSILGISDDRYHVGITAEMRATLLNQLNPQVDSGLQQSIVADEVELANGTFSVLDRVFTVESTSQKQVICWTDKWSVCPLTGHTGYWLMHLFVTNDIQKRLLFATGELDYDTAEEALRYKTREIHWAISKGLPYTVAIPLASVLYSELGIVELVDQIDTNYLQTTVHNLLAELNMDDHAQYALLAGRPGDVLHIETIVMDNITIANSTITSTHPLLLDASEVRIGGPQNHAFVVSSVLSADADRVLIDVPVVLDGSSQVVPTEHSLIMGDSLFWENEDHDVWSAINTGTLRIQPCTPAGVPVLEDVLTIQREGRVGINCEPTSIFAVADVGMLMEVSETELWTSVPIRVDATGDQILMGDVWELGTSGGAYIRAPSLLINATLAVTDSFFVDTTVRASIPVSIDAGGAVSDVAFQIDRDGDLVVSISAGEALFNTTVVLGGSSTGIEAFGAAVVKNDLLWEGPQVMGIDNDNGVLRVNAYNPTGTVFQPSNILSIGASGHVAINSAPTSAFFSVSDLDGNVLFNVSQAGVSMSTTPTFVFNNGSGQVLIENSAGNLQATIGLRQNGILYMWQSLGNSATEINLPSTSAFSVNTVSAANVVTKPRLTVSDALALVNVDMGLGVQTGAMLQGTNVFQVDSGGAAKFEVDPTTIRNNVPTWFRSSTSADQVLLASTGGGRAVIGVAQSATASARKLYLWQSNAADIAVNLPSGGRFVVSTASGQTDGNPTSGSFTERATFENAVARLKTQTIIDTSTSPMLIVRLSGANKLIAYGTYMQSLVPLRIDYVDGTSQIALQRLGGTYSGNIGVRATYEMFLHQNTGSNALQLNVLSTSKVSVNTVDTSNVVTAERLSITSALVTSTIPVTINANSVAALVVTAAADTIISAGNAGTSINAPTGTIQLKNANVARVTVGASDTTLSTLLKCAHQAGGAQITLQRNTGGIYMGNIGIRSTDELFVWQRSGSAELQMNVPIGASFSINTVDDSNAIVSVRMVVSGTAITTSLPLTVDKDSTSALTVKNGATTHFVAGTGGAAVTADTATAFVVNTGSSTLISSGNAGTVIDTPTGSIILKTDNTARVTVETAQTTISNLARITYQSGNPQVSLQRADSAYMGSLGIRSTNDMFMWQRSGSRELQMNVPSTSSFSVNTVSDSNVFTSYRMLISSTQITNYLPTVIEYQAGELQLLFKNSGGIANSGIGYNTNGDIVMSQLEAGKDIELRLPDSATSNIAFTSYNGATLVSKPLQVFQSSVEANARTRINPNGDIASGNIFDVSKAAGSMAFEIDAVQMRVAVDSIVGIGGRIIKAARMNLALPVSLSESTITIFTVTIASSTINRMARINGMLQLLQYETADGTRVVTTTVACTNTDLGTVTSHGFLINYNSGPNYAFIVVADNYFSLNGGTTSVCTVKAIASSAIDSVVLISSFVQVTTYVKDDSVMSVSSGSSATI